MPAVVIPQDPAHSAAPSSVCDQSIEHDLDKKTLNQFIIMQGVASPFPRRSLALLLIVSLAGECATQQADMGSQITA
jgi:hypothetical protein